jgi:hypothetical protein
MPDALIRASALDVGHEAVEVVRACARGGQGTVEQGS